MTCAVLYAVVRSLTVFRSGILAVQDAELDAGYVADVKRAFSRCVANVDCDAYEKLTWCIVSAK